MCAWDLILRWNFDEEKHPVSTCGGACSVIWPLSTPYRDLKQWDSESRWVSLGHRYVVGKGYEIWVWGGFDDSPSSECGWSGLGIVKGEPSLCKSLTLTWKQWVDSGRSILNQIQTNSVSILIQHWSGGLSWMGAEGSRSSDKLWKNIHSFVGLVKVIRRNRDSIGLYWRCSEYRRHYGLPGNR